MVDLAIVTFLFSRPGKWAQLNYEEYHAEHVNALWRACADNIKIPHRFIAYTESPDGIKCERRECFPSIYVPHPNGRQENGCYQRLRMYDPEVQASLDAEHILILDLDTVFMGDCTSLIEACMEHDFTALRGSPWTNGALCSWYNGSFQMCRNGARPKFWRDFNPATFYAQRERYKMSNGRRPHGTDQAWLTVCAGPGENTLWEEHGVYQYRYIRRDVPKDAKLLFFAGKEKPWFGSVMEQNPKVGARWHQYAEPVEIAA
jgi:hypothetical protein